MINIEKILKIEPTLTPFGIEEPGILQSNDIEFTADDMNQIQTCIDWLKDKTVDNKINRISTSYGIKHIIERELNTNIANGCLIAAVIQLDIPFEKIPNSPNIHVAISASELYKNDPNNVNRIVSF